MTGWICSTFDFSMMEAIRQEDSKGDDSPLVTDGGIDVQVVHEVADIGIQDRTISSGASEPG